MLFARSVLLQLVLSSVSQRNMPNDVLRAPTLRRRMKHNFRISYVSTQLMNENWHIFAIPMHTAIKSKLRFWNSVQMSLTWFGFDSNMLPLQLHQRAQAKQYILMYIQFDSPPIEISVEWMCADKEQEMLSYCRSPSINVEYTYMNWDKRPYYGDGSRDAPMKTQSISTIER